MDSSSENQVIADDVSLISPRLDSTTSDNLQRPKCVPYRYWLCSVMFLGLMQVYLVRINFNIALVAMVNYTAEDANNNDTSDECPGPPNPKNTSKTDQTGEFDWDAHIQSELLSAFFYGYVVLQIPGGYLAQVVGPKLIIGMAVLISSLLSFLSPWAAWWSPWALFALRVCMGIAQGPIFPSTSALWGRWAPPLERTLLYSIAANGSSFGAIIAPILTGALSSTSFCGGWPLNFWLFGLTGILWSLLWFWFGCDSPQQHPNLSAEEKIAHAEVLSEARTLNRQDLPCPALLLSRPAWAIILYQLCDGLSFYSMFSGVPIYMKQVLKFDIAENGVLSGLPYAASVVGSFIAGFLADWLRTHYLRTITTRRLFAFFSEGCQLFVLLGMGFVPCDWRLAVFLYVTSCFLVGLSAAVASVNILDIAPHQAGLLMGVSNFGTNIGGFVAPLVVGAITHEGGNRFAWQKVFWMAGCVYMVGTLLFILLASGDVQSWSKPPVDDETITIQHPDINAGDIDEEEDR